MTETWKVGAVAQSSGLTVRTLHYWDQIGLVTPSLRGAGGHREYIADDLGQLYVVLVLRDLGLPLESIRTCLGGGLDPARVLTDQLTRIDTALDTLNQLRELVSRVLTAGVDDREISDPNELLQLLRDSRPDSRDVLDGYLDDQQRSDLADHAAAVGPALPYLLEVEFPQLYRQADALRRGGASPDDERMRPIVSRLDELSTMLGGKNSGAGLQVRAAWRDHPAAMSGESAQTAAPWSDLAGFVESARAAFGSASGVSS